eukprot:TRINITY_DN105435_c0_g1_i1.p1 TRINITY_DN105435_c0_g1~~TRINITY_DN105435_c0_g1_i1.p1  ORF type:complete len:299 (+),score=54.57 TRINITY_DN105435_c0_g1_i1:27-899(+)
MESREIPQKVHLLDGTDLPCEILGDPAHCPLIWGHGLGPSDPRGMNRRTCESFPMVQDAITPGQGDSAESAEVLRRAKEAGTSTESLSFNAVLYDARGHGASSGWEAMASCIQQFHWRSLAFDMLSVAMQHQGLACSRLRRFGPVLGGYSMGASSALWAAYSYPTAARGLVLLCVTTAWEIRKARRGNLLKNAEELQVSDSAAAEVVRGAAFSDLPSVEDLRSAELRMPVLLCASRDDATHPAEVAERLASALPTAELVLQDTKEELRLAFPGILRGWLRRHFAAASTDE